MKQSEFTDIIHKISFAGKNRLEIFLRLPENRRANVLLHLSKHIQTSLLSDLSDEKIVQIVEFLDPDEVTDLIQLLPKKRQPKVITALQADLRASVEILKEFDPQSAAGLMNLDYIQVDVEDTMEEVVRQCKKHEKRTGRVPVIFVMEDLTLKGHIPGHRLGLAKSSDKAKKHAEKVQTIMHNTNHSEVLHVFRTHPHNKIAVLGPKKTIVGVIYADDLLKLLKEKETSALYDFAGVSDEENVSDSILQKVKHRYKWLILNLGTAFLAAFTVGLFDEVIAAYVILAAYMPIVAGMGGNAGTQTLAVLVRGIALNQISLKTAWPVLRKEVAAGVINGAINGILVAFIVFFFNRDIKIALILGTAMIANLFIAAFFGTLVPLIMKKLGKDPAASATIFITTATDVLGFLAFLGLATAILL